MRMSEGVYGETVEVEVEVEEEGKTRWWAVERAVGPDPMMITLGEVEVEEEKAHDWEEGRARK